MMPHFLRCQGFAVDNYSVDLGRLETAASSTFAALGFIQPIYHRAMTDTVKILKQKTDVRSQRTELRISEFIHRFPEI